VYKGREGSFTPTRWPKGIQDVDRNHFRTTIPRS
jgi:hypothetical protein